MGSYIKERTKNLFNYFLAVKKNIDNQSKILNIQDKDLIKITGFEESNYIDINKDKKLSGFIKRKRVEKDLFVSKGLIVNKKNKNVYPFILKKIYYTEDKSEVDFSNECIEFPLEALPKNLSSDYILISLKKQFASHYITDFNNDKLGSFINLIMQRIGELKEYSIEEGYFILRRGREDKLIYNELNKMINSLNETDKTTQLFVNLLGGDGLEEVACSALEEREVWENILINGPAGCGKSEKVKELTFQLLSQGKRILITGTKDSSLMALENRFLKDIKPLIFSIYNEDIKLDKYNKNFQEIKKRRGVDINKLENIIKKLERGNTYNKNADNLKLKLYEYCVNAINLIKETNYLNLDIVFRKSEVLIDLPPQNEITLKVEELIKRKRELEYHYDIIKNLKVVYESKYDEENLINTINYGKSLLNKIKGTYAERVLLDSDDEGIEKLSSFIENIKNKVSYMIKKIGIEVIEMQEFENNEMTLLEKKLHLLENQDNSEKEEDFYKSVLTIKKGIIDEFNGNSKKYGYEKVNEDQLYLIDKVLNDLEICKNWDININNKIKKYLGNISFYNDVRLRTIEELDNLIIKFESIKEINKYFDVFGYVERLKMSLFLEEDFKGLYIAIDELNIENIKECYIEIDELRRMLPEIMKLKSYLNKLYDISQVPIDKILKKYSNPTVRWEAIFNVLIRYKEDNKKYYNKKDLELPKDNVLLVLKSWYYFIKNSNIDDNTILNQWFSGGKDNFEDIKSLFRVCIMPMNKVLELIPPKEDSFDVVIIEDCNQCEIAYLPLLLRGKNFIITGDDKQYTPQFPGIDKKIIENNLKAYFKEDKDIETFNYFNNLYQLLEKYASEKIFLYHQYRFNRSIATLLNENFYKNKIIPTIEDNPNFKAINSIYVKDGIRDKDKIINQKEAVAIVDQIIKCIKNPVYKNKTIGVISLLGYDQGELINKLLKDRITTEELEARKIVCGDFYCLQGEERDILFLSMVVANNVKFMAQTKENDYKRFNHALSRGKEQLWLFHSVKLADINKECVRHKILRYFIEEKEAHCETA